MENPFKKLSALVASLEEDFTKSYEKNNSAAGTRVRKGMQELKDIAGTVRKDVQAGKNAVKATKK
jgi:hypothetical protein